MTIIFGNNGSWSILLLTSFQRDIQAGRVPPGAEPWWNHRRPPGRTPTPRNNISGWPILCGGMVGDHGGVERGGGSSNVYIYILNYIYIFI